MVCLSWLCLHVLQKIRFPNHRIANGKQEQMNVNNVHIIGIYIMVNVLKNQHLFYQALDVLDILVTKGADHEKIEQEREVIKDLIKEQNN